MNIRYPAVEDSFYPAKKSEVETMINRFEKNVKYEDNNQNIIPRAVISPHAGYIYSGQVATAAFKLLKNLKQKVKRIIVIAPSHRISFNGISAGYFDYYRINGENIPIDLSYLKKLTGQFEIGFLKQAHEYEHAGEVQIPFIKHYLHDFKLITLVYGNCNHETLTEITQYLLNDENNIVVISSDLSHYHPYDLCMEIDKKVLNGVLTSDIDLISQGEACGMIGIKAVTAAAERLNLNRKLLDYRNSGDTSGDKSAVVGYASFVFYK